MIYCKNLTIPVAILLDPYKSLCITSLLIKDASVVVVLVVEVVVVVLVVVLVWYGRLYK